MAPAGSIIGRSPGMGLIDYWPSGPAAAASPQDAENRAMPAFRVRVQPGASHNRIEEFRDEALRVRVTAPPEKGRANAAVIDLLAEFLGLSSSRLRIVRGATSRVKVIEVEGLDQAELEARLKMPRKVGGD